ncbi:thioesterase-like superfamily-domain-containing protein [Amylocarpus encephaloides]|uniref:Thioesterase-like superfamily-domain-containing protein n=1 Tax=Amylocarpus encephaloides TaxID=45428 RepID=A0A9P8C3C5_9HELO|nr:thioesterase-like superfamily-domain-containing protein [Amylocarpus encephaloides]
MPAHAEATLYPPPSLDFSYAPIEHPLQLTALRSEEDVFTNTYPLWNPPPGRALFGGILIGQAIHAAQQTVSPVLVIYNMHCTFHAAPNALKPLYYHVVRMGGGRSSVSREVRAEQDGRVFFSAMCNFYTTGKENPTLHQVKLPQVGQHDMEAPDKPEKPSTNESALTEQIVLSGFLTFAGPKTTREDVDPFLWKELPVISSSDTVPSTNVLHSWTRSRGQMSSSQTSNIAVLGFLTDSWFLSSFPEVNPKATGSYGQHIGFMVTLNHTIWFHDPQVRIDEWLFVKRTSTWAAKGRCLMEQQIWGKGAKLAATCVQEGIVRLKTPQPTKTKGQEVNASKI